MTQTTIVLSDLVHLANPAKSPSGIGYICISPFSDAIERWPGPFPTSRRPPRHVHLKLDWSTAGGEISSVCVHRIRLDGYHVDGPICMDGSHDGFIARTAILDCDDDILATVDSVEDELPGVIKEGRFDALLRSDTTQRDIPIPQSNLISI